MTDLAAAKHFVSTLFAGWHEVKSLIEAIQVVSEDALHVIAGFLVQILFAAVLRRPLSSWGPWLAVVAILLFNEAVDFWVERWPSLAIQLGESVKDLLLTLFLPSVLMLALRFWPALSARSRR